MEMLLEKRVGSLENLMNKLGQAQGLTNSVVMELVNGVTTEIKTQVKQEMTLQKEEIKNDLVLQLDNSVNETVRKAVNERGLNRKEMNELTKIRNKKFAQLLGDSHSDKYILLISFYQASLAKAYRKEFDCCAYGDIEATRYKDAIKFIENFCVSDNYHQWAINKIHEKYRDGEIENKRKINAYERYFGIK